MKISRRNFLRGATGAIVALPFLPSLARGAVPRPKRFVAFCHPNGVFEWSLSCQPPDIPPPAWYPTGSGTGYTLGTTHASLESLKPHLLWTTGLNMSVAITGAGEQHQRGLGGLLTGTELMAGVFVGNDGTKAGWASGPSIDQELINYLGAGSKSASLQLGVHAAERDVSGALSYAAAAQPLLPQNDPVVVFRSLFSDIATPPGTLELIRRRRQSVLDGVIAQTTSLQSRLAASERVQLDQHLSMVRDLEMRVSAATVPSPTLQTCTQATEPPSLLPMDISNMSAISKMQLDLLVLALQCDLVRIATIAYSDVKNHISLPFLGVTSDVHNVSHASDPLSLDQRQTSIRLQLIKRDVWQSEQFAYFVQRLLDTPSGDGTLLDDTLAFWGSEVSMGNTHSHLDMPFVFAGHAAGWTMGRALQFSGQAHNNLLVSMLQSFGSPAATFGEPSYCDNPLTGLF